MDIEAVMANTLRIWLVGPMQSWGSSSRFDVRMTDQAPTKSGVVGLISAALGRDRATDVSDLGRLRFGVRIERRGPVERDFHSAGAGTDPIAVASGSKSQARGTVSERYFVTDSVFVVGLEASTVEELSVLEEARAALATPRWPLFLGRKSFPPAWPLVDDKSLIPERLEDALLAIWWPGHPDGEAAAGALNGFPSEQDNEDVELRIERSTAGAPNGESSGVVLEQADQPLGAAFRDRRFTRRQVEVRYVPREAQS